MQVKTSKVDLKTATGTMRCYIYEPNVQGVYPSVIFYSEIFQLTAPISRSAAVIASHGFVVIVPEVFHELNPIGTVLGYDDEGKNKGNQDKWTKNLTSYDSDLQAMIDFNDTLAHTNNKIGVIGVCIGGHLACRAAIHSRIKAAFCLYATDLHSETLPANDHQQTFQRLSEIKGEIHFVWGKQDPHVPKEGRIKIYQALQQHELNFQWLEVNAEHAFMRDEGERYDPALAMTMYQNAVALFQRVLSS